MKRITKSHLSHRCEMWFSNLKALVAKYEQKHCVSSPSYFDELSYTLLPHTHMYAYFILIFWNICKQVYKPKSQNLHTERKNSSHLFMKSENEPRSKGSLFDISTFKRVLIVVTVLWKKKYTNTRNICSAIVKHNSAFGT